MSAGKYILAFTIGAATGAYISWKLLKKKYAELAQEEIDSVKEVFRTANPTEVYQIDDIDDTDIQDDYESITGEYQSSRSGVVGWSYKPEDTLDKDHHGSVKNAGKKPMLERVPVDFYVISPDEFGEIPEYSKFTLNYYSDGVVTDELDEPVEDYEDLIGADFADHYGEYEDDSVFIKNDAHYAYYEILRDNRNYADIINSGPGYRV